MNDLEKISSPCIRNCCLDQYDICIGCNRSLQEIREWAAASAAEKRAILVRSAVRETRRHKTFTSDKK
ncbi:DUF1289 domain-containing protein [Neptunomonas antarctica]|nr:DUF1289 domain-containing protein [Neptunomonas antarctica]